MKRTSKFRIFGEGEGEKGGRKVIKRLVEVFSMRDA